MIPEWLQPFIGLTPLAFLRYGGLIAIPFLVRKMRQSDQSIRSQLLGWNTSFVGYALLGDVLLELAIWLRPWETMEDPGWGVWTFWLVVFLGLAVSFIGRVYYGLSGILKTVRVIRSYFTP